MNDYEEFRKRLLQQDMWEILGKWTGFAAIGVGILLTLCSLVWPQTFQLSLFCVLGTSVAMVYTTYSISRMQEAGKDATTALQRFLASVGTTY